MSDLAFLANGDLDADLKIENGDYSEDKGLQTAVLISLYTDRYVDPEDLPPNISDPQGWWGDSLLDKEGDRWGSRLWVYDRIGKINTDTRNGMRSACEEALEWMVDEGIAEKVVVSAVLVQNTRIDISIEIYRPVGEENAVFDFLWEGQELKRA